MNKPLHFKNRAEFRNWLTDNALSDNGVWLLFGKTAELQTIKAEEALEEALCFGWIDGLMKRIDDKSYIKYFSIRKKNSKWSEKNKALVEKLEKENLLTDYGRMKIAEAKKNGQWDSADKSYIVTDEQISIVNELLKDNELAYSNFQNMSLSVRKTYTRAYFSAKTETGRANRLKWMMERLEKNLKPM